MTDFECSTAALSEVLGITAQAIGKLVRQGVIKRVRHGVYDLREVVPAYLQMKLAHSLALRQKTTSSIDEERRRKLWLENEQLERQLIDFDDACDAMDQVVGGLRADLMAVPSRITRDVLQREIIEKEIESAFAIARKRLTDRAAVLKGGADPDNQPDNEP